jgi:hypothetical protein
LSLQRCEGKNLESVLEEVRNRFGDTVAIVEANRLRKGGVGGFFARERFEVVVEVDEADGSAPGLTELPAEFGLEATEDFCDRLLRLADGVSDLDRTTPPSSISTEQPRFSAVLESITQHMEVAPAPAPAPASAPAPAPEPAPPAIDTRALARIGLPEEIRRAAVAHPAPAAGTDPSAWLLGLLEELPVAEPLPQGPGSVIVVAGGREAALYLGRQIAEELRLDPDTLLIASPGYKSRAIPPERRITAVETAAEARRSWRRRRRPTIVAVEAPMGRSCDWARQVIDAFEPTMVWGAVDATCKPDDLFDWAERLGGFDALGVTDFGATVSPATVLQCGIPVGRVDGLPATPALWATLLAPRLAG